LNSFYYNIIDKDKINGYEVLQKLERAGRVCYKSEDKIDKGTAYNFVKKLISRGHHSVLEHYSFTVCFNVDRAVSHELVRHRLASFSQSSTRYCDYTQGKFNNEINFSDFIPRCDSETRDKIIEHLKNTEDLYKHLKDKGVKNDLRRRILPLSTMTELYITANLREWRHILKLRSNKSADDLLYNLMQELLWELKSIFPVIFDDIFQQNIYLGD